MTEPAVHGVQRAPTYARHNRCGSTSFPRPGRRARALAESGRTAEALDEFKAVSDYFAGAEARVRWAMLLEAAGRKAEAQAIYAGVLTQMRRAPKYVRKVQAEWIAIADNCAHSQWI